ncbi:hypothetical protein HZH66_003693 [Vespula vulgaris]|uniref:Transcription elongation factor SPT6 n=1 Tax=Vespula vulgaris TaxID=7454 RepID=A0A834KF61_VESVU|nr:hypothetical protein HZH66_003693 [Vespula vulgaris]
MADFLESEAEESEEEEALDQNEKKKLKKIKAVEESDEEDDDDGEEVADLIDDNPIEEESDAEDSDTSGGTKKRKKSDDEDFDDRLEEEDYDLIEENLGVKLERKRRFKRLRRIQDEESEDEQEKEPDEERDAIATELFEGSGDEEERRSERSHRPEVETLEEEGSEGDDDMNDFIVDEDGRSLAEKRMKKKPIFSDAALQEAQDIFGVDFDFDEFGKFGEEDYEEEEEEEEDDEYLDDDADERPRRSKKQFNNKSTRKSIFEIYEPSELKRGHFTDLDNEIRNTDIPERMQLRSVPVIPVAEGSDELDLEAEWIYKQAFCRPTISIQDAHLNEEAKERAKKGPQTIGKIKKALDFMRNQHFEVPFISFYRKEYVFPELNINDLWKVYKFDAKWCQLRQRKENLLKLFKKMRNYQLDEIMKNPDAPLPDNVRIIKDDDIERLKNIQTTKECVMRACCRKMYNWIKVAPYFCEFPEEEDEEWDTSKGLRVMGLAYVPDYSQAAFTCIVSADGECTDYVRLPHLLKRKNSFREDEKVMKEADLLALKNFIATKKPHVVVIGGESREALMIASDVKECISNLMEDEQFPGIQVEICENELAKIYSNSNKGISEFRDYPELLRQAISLARRMQDPLVEFSQLCTADEEILCLKYHPLQDQLLKEELLENLYLEFVNRVNEVGVDVNKTVQQAYSGNLVQFICGFGPRKGQALVKILKQTNQRLENRTQLVTAYHMGPKVFINCAGFIKIDTNSLGDSTEAYVEVLDGSRVHPETYEWARKMAVDALEYDDEDANPAGALEEILESPERLKDLDLDAFAEELERQGFGNKCVTLYDIRAELNSRYKDLRLLYQSPSPEKLFDILTKETPETFYIGKLVLATVVGISHRKPQGEQLDQANPVRNDETGLWQCPFCLKNDFPELSEVWNHFDAGACPGKATGVRLRLDNGVSGYIHIKNLSDKHVANPEERVSIGQVIHCRIIKIEVERFSVECTSKSSDLADKNHEWRPQRDIYYDTEAHDKDVKIEEDAKKIKQRQTYVKRVIIHPSFHNISFAESEKLMQNMKQGEGIIRPSSKGADHLTVTWKVTDNIYQHIDVREEGKENAFSLGHSLWIGNEEFEDLDEIIARHVNPMAAYASELLDFKYYKTDVEGVKDKAEEILKEQKKQNPGGIPYIISAAKNYPGKFLLSYLPRIRCRHEYVSVSPDGFKFRGQIFSRVNDLFRWFKEHFRDPIPGQLTPGTPHGALTSKTSYHATPGAVTGMSQDAIQRVAQNLPHHMLHSLSQVANQTPHHYPPHTPGATSTTAYGGMHTYPNTPYTPSGQTPFMTPYQTPHHTPHHTQQTPNHHQGQFLHPVSSSMPSVNQRSMRSHRPTPSMSTPSSGDAMDWSKAAEAWARLKQSTPRGTASTPRYEESRKTPRNYEDSTGRTTPRNRTPSNRTPSYKSPRGTPFTNSSPRSMSLSGDGTPLYDES